jgi:hypothetical protein
MTTAPDGLPPQPGRQEALFLAPPAAQAGPWPERRKLARWHIATLMIGGPIVAFFTAIGANTFAHHFIDGPPAAHVPAVADHKPEAHKAKPAYDLAGYRSAISGPERRAFTSALRKLRADITRPDYVAAGTDAGNLITAANIWLTQLRRTNPPPAYRPGKLSYETAALLGRRAGAATQNGLNAADLTLLQRGADLAARARWVLSRAPGSAQGS